MTVQELYNKWVARISTHPGGVTPNARTSAILEALLERLGIPEGSTFQEIELKIADLEGKRSASDASAKQAWLECERAIAAARRAKDDHHAAATLAQAFRADGDRAWKAANQAADELRRARRDLRNWERKYERVRKALDPEGKLSEEHFTLEEAAAASRACRRVPRTAFEVLDLLSVASAAVDKVRAAQKERDRG